MLLNSSHKIMTVWRQRLPNKQPSFQVLLNIPDTSNPLSSSGTKSFQQLSFANGLVAAEMDPCSNQRAALNCRGISIWAQKQAPAHSILKSGEGRGIIISEDQFFANKYTVAIKEFNSEAEPHDQQTFQFKYSFQGVQLFFYMYFAGASCD